MALAIRDEKWEHAARRFLVWMAIGTAFILALVSADYFGRIPIP